MKPITIRGVSEETAEYIRREATRKKLSLNKVVVSLLDKGAGCEPEKAAGAAPYHDLDELFGIWSREEAESLDATLRDLRKIDQEDWA